MAKITITRECKNYKGEDIIYYDNISKAVGLTFWDRRTEWGELFKWESVLVDVHEAREPMQRHMDVSQIVKMDFSGSVTVGVKIDEEVFIGCYIPKVVEAYLNLEEGYKGYISFNRYDGCPTIEIHHGEDKVFDAHIGNLAYIKFEN